MERAVLHSDLNCFYASVEIMLNPSLRGKAVAVCGSTDERHGIVLAKSELAKKAGIKTGMVNWEARQRCPGLIIVPPHYDQYIKYSKLVRDIYYRYTDQVEPYGMDECWLDVTGSVGIYGAGPRIAESIRRTVREEMGMTVSIGVSFNKIYAKLGSDLKKPDAVTIIGKDDYKDIVWPLPVSDLLFCGRSTTKKLMRYGISTIGALAEASVDFLHSLLGKNGLMLRTYARGDDQSRVMHKDFESPIKSIGHGITCVADLVDNEEAWKVILHLSQDIGHRLRVHELCARGVQITVKDNDLAYRQYQAPLEAATQSPLEIAQLARQLFEQNYDWHTYVRAVTVRAINLMPKASPLQLSIFGDQERLDKQQRLDDAVEEIRRRFGKNAVIPAALMGDLKIPVTSTHDLILPGAIYK